jgi:hypothetical protein
MVRLRGLVLLVLLLVLLVPFGCFILALFWGAAQAQYYQVRQRAPGSPSSSMGGGDGSTSSVALDPPYFFH